MNLLELPSGMISLEYVSEEQGQVRARLDAIAAVSVKRHATYSEVKVGNESLLGINDWDEPCLIAQSEAGNAILRQVAGSGDSKTAIAAE